MKTHSRINTKNQKNWKKPKLFKLETNRTLGGNPGLPEGTQFGGSMS
jgi:hypothetical protein